MANFKVANTAELRYFAYRENTTTEEMGKRIIEHLPKLIDFQEVADMEFFGIPIEYIYPDDILVKTITDVMKDCGIQNITYSDYEKFNHLNLILC